VQTVDAPVAGITETLQAVLWVLPRLQSGLVVGVVNVELVLAVAALLADPAAIVHDKKAHPLPLWVPQEFGVFVFCHAVST